MIRQYMSYSAASGLSPATVLARASAIKSYLAANDLPVEVRGAAGRAPI